MDSLRLIGPLLLALGTAWWVDSATARRGLLPPLQAIHQDPAGLPIRSAMSIYRRALSGFALTMVLYIGVFAPLGLLGQEIVIDFASVPIARLFQLHGIFAIFIVGWYLLGFVPRRSAGPGERDRGWSIARQLGFEPSRGGSGHARWRDVGREVGLGMLFGVAGWLAVLAILLLIGSAVWMLGGEDALPSDPPPMVVWVAALPWTVRLGISLSAGVVEETFFRGLLQPRCGIALSTVLFVLAHAGYEQVLMLVGVTLLSLFFSALVVWRQSIIAAITAHAVFDAVQLLVVIPSIMKLMGHSEPAAGWLASLARVGLALLD